MLRGRSRQAQFCLLLADAAATVAAFMAAYYFAGVGLQNMWPTSFRVVLPLASYWWVPVAAVPMWWLLFAFTGGYGLSRIRPAWGSLRGLIAPLAIGVLIIGFAVFVFKEKEFARRVIGAFLVLNCGLILIERRLIASAIRRMGPRRHLLIVGSPQGIARFASAVADFGPGMQIVGVVGPDSFEQLPMLGKIADLPRILEEQVVDDVVITDAVGGIEQIRDAVRACEIVGVDVHIEAGFFDATLARPYLQSVRSAQLLTFSRVPFNPLMLAVKRALDIIISIVALLGFSPGLLFILATVKLTSPGPAFFRQERVGLNGRRFTLYKFRSMRAGAEAMRDEVAPLNVMDGPVFKAKHDPRVTPFGSRLRRRGFDELPQLWNVLKGDMSLVGPRPPLPSEVPAYERWQRRRLSMRPGITGLWQVSGGHSLSFAEWMACDLRYIDAWSLRLDLSILLRTIPLIVMGKGM